VRISGKVTTSLFSLFAVLVLTGCGGSPEIPTGSSSPEAPAASTPSGRKININTAILSELDRIEAELAVPALSNRIQAERPYASPDELVAKKVLTPEQYARVKDQLTVEDIVLAGEAKDIDYMTKLGLMRGHLLVARELLASGESAAALPHIGHPIEEIYLDIEGQLDERGVAQFKSILLELQQLVRFSATSPKVAPALAAALAAIDGAMNALPATQRRTPAFVLQVIDQLLEAAGTEYAAAVNNGRIAARIEYEDSRGFVTYAEQLFADIAPTLQSTDPTAARQLSAGLAEIKRAWPSVAAPRTVVLSPEQVRERIKDIERAGQKV
jgi:hypothetical protein